MAIDVRLSRRLQLPAARVWTRRLAALGAHLGDSWIWLIGSACGLLFGGPAARRLVLALAIAVLLSVGIGSAVKYRARRPRPADVSGFYSKRLDHYSFPSGHAARVACVAMIFGAAYPPWAAGLALYALVVVTCRVALGIHYLGDVLAGLALGALASCLILVLW